MYVVIAVIILFVLAAVLFDAPIPLIGAPQPTATEPVSDLSKMQTEGFLDGAESEQARSGLDRDRNSARQQPMASDRGRPTEPSGLSAQETITKDSEANLQSAREVAFADKLAEANRNTAAQVEVVQKRLESEQVKATSLDRDLAGARQQLAQAGREKVVGNDERRPFEAAAADNETKLQNEQTAGEAQKAARADNLQHVTDHQSPINSEPNTTAQIEAVRQNAGSKRAAFERSEASVAGAARLAARSSDLPPPLTSPAIGALSKIAPPEGVPARVVLRYARGSEAARTRAIALRLTLQAQGFDVTDPVNGPSGIVANGVTFFYREDQSSASRIAGVLATSGPIQSHLPANDPLPRPGTIEVAVAG